MCFSSEASFTAAIILVPTGIYSIYYAIRFCREYVGFALFPFAFGIQQFFEGLTWIFLTDQTTYIGAGALGFLFFSHFFWVFIVPLSTWLAEDNVSRKKILLTLTIFGGFLGVSLLLPLLINDGWFSASIRQESIFYSIRKIYDGYLSTGALLSIYIFTIIAPLLVSSNNDVRLFGGILAVSMFVTLVFYTTVFVSVWCFFAAILSLIILMILKRHSLR